VCTVYVPVPYLQWHTCSLLGYCFTALVINISQFLSKESLNGIGNDMSRLIANTGDSLK